MIAYFALLAFVPLLFLVLSLIALAGQQGEVQLPDRGAPPLFPASSVDRLVDVVDDIRGNATTLGIIGAIGLVWSALGFFSVLESAFNIVYGLPNRSFIRRSSLVLLLSGRARRALLVALLVCSLGIELARQARRRRGSLYVYALAVSTALVFGFLWTVYRVLTNEPLAWRETLPRRAFAAVLLQASFQLLPVFVRAADESSWRSRPSGPRAPALLALPDGERHRARRRGELVARAPPPGARRGCRSRARVASSCVGSSASPARRAARQRRTSRWISGWCSRRLQNAWLVRTKKRSVALRRDGRRPRPVLDERDLAEEVARAERSDGLAAPSSPPPRPPGSRRTRGPSPPPCRASCPRAPRGPP